MSEEHTPAPQESRGIYGFVLFVMMNMCTFTYFIWMLLPSDLIKNLPYEPPQPYWGLAVPIYFCTTLFLFAFCIYPSMHGLHDGELDEKSAYTDIYSLPANYFVEKRTKAAKNQKKDTSSTIHNIKPRISSTSTARILSYKSRTWSLLDKESYANNQRKLQQQDLFGADACKPIPPVSDMDLDEVCKILYLNNEKN